MRKHNCPACNALKHGIKSRRAFEHSGCEFDRHSIGLKNHEGHATFIGKPTQEMIDAVNTLADLAYKHLKNKNMQQLEITNDTRASHLEKFCGDSLIQFTGRTKVKTKDGDIVLEFGDTIVKNKDGFTVLKSGTGKK